ncbi:MAG: TetR/AcrR family transcriptional regulator [Fimbriimonas sp.]
MSRMILRREGRRRAVLDAALELFDQEGYRGVSMRGLSERVGLTAGALYRYFPSKEAVFDALAEEGFQRLIELVEEIRDGTALERLYAQGMAYLEFAAEEPRRYRIMFLTPETTPSARKAERTDVSKRSFGTVVQRIVEAQTEGTVPADVDPMVAAHVCWAAWHGAATSEAVGMLTLLPPECRAALRERVIRMSIEGVRT